MRMLASLSLSALCLLAVSCGSNQSSTTSTDTTSATTASTDSSSGGSTAGIQIVAMGVISPKDSTEWRKAFDLAKEFGLSYITCEPAKNQYDMIDKMAGEYGIK